MTRSRWRLLSLVALTAPSGAQEARAIPPCRQPQVELRVANAGVGMSHWAEGLEFLNKSADTCFLRGVPKLVFDGENDARLAVAICPNCDDYLFPARPETTVILKSRETSHVLVGSSTAYDSKFCGRARAYTSFPAGGNPSAVCEGTRTLLLCEGRCLGFSSGANPKRLTLGWPNRTSTGATVGACKPRRSGFAHTVFTLAAPRHSWIPSCVARTRSVRASGAPMSISHSAHLAGGENGAVRHID